MKQFLLRFVGLSLISTVAFGQSTNSNATQFALQAGAIAGAVQACNQNISVFNSRVTEVINTLGKTAEDRANAATVYQKALTATQASQLQNHTLNCNALVTRFQSLPLMRADYEQSVMPQMAKMAEGETSSASASPKTTAPAAPVAIPATARTQTMVTANGS